MEVEGRNNKLTPLGYEEVQGTRKQNVWPESRLRLLPRNQSTSVDSGYFKPGIICPKIETRKNREFDLRKTTSELLSLRNQENNWPTYWS